MASHALTPGDTAGSRVWTGKVERIALGAALALHVVVIGALLIDYGWDEDPVRETRMTVSLASEVSLENTGPQIVEESRASLAPTLSDTPAPVVEAEREAAATPAPSTRPPPTPAPARDRQRPDRPPPPQQQQRQQRETTSSAQKGGAGDIGKDFLDGLGESPTTDRTEAPAAKFGRAEKAALSSAITRQLRPHWNAPTGADAEKLVSIVSWRLNRDGTLAGRPTCRNEPGSITDSNRPQAGLHCERAIRAVQLAAPFNLPEQFYSRWDDLEWQFDRRL
jgi:hypothetical protein